MNYYLNIIDPLISENNLGKSISNFNSKRIKRVIANQFIKYKNLLAKRRNNPIEYKQEMLSFFSKIYLVMGKTAADVEMMITPQCKLMSSGVLQQFADNPYGIFNPY